MEGRTGAWLRHPPVLVALAEWTCRKPPSHRNPPNSPSEVQPEGKEMLDGRSWMVGKRSIDGL
jgi:hypothetical protein